MMGSRARHDLGRPAHAGAGRRPLLLGSLPGLRARRRRARLLVRARHDREPRRRGARRRRCRLRAREHEPPDRRRHRARGDQHHRRDRDSSYANAHGVSADERRPRRSRLPDLVHRPRRPARRRARDRRSLPPAGARAPRRRGRSAPSCRRPHEHRATTGRHAASRSTTCCAGSTPSDGSNFCSRPQGAYAPALEQEAMRTREQLAELVR